ncbi:EF-hand domain-containing protein [Halomonas sp. HG01]|uniref:EF-hand domain-containing protein n=1 Tax=Halomonas sp. HG01 TaxID=1609967 RepID=UPI0006149831|nr:EF-hand domain-containing protein [Halomonas sp. HG01]
MKTLLKTTLLTFALLGAGAAVANPPSFDRLDLNGDGMLSAEEALTVDGIDLETADTNGDGALSREEYEAARQSLPGGADGSMNGSSEMGGSAGLSGSGSMTGSGDMSGAGEMSGSTEMSGSAGQSTAQ